MRFYNWLGRVAYRLLLPLIRLAIKRTQRVYVLIQANDEILLVQNWLSRQDWHLPGGGIHRGENPRQTVIREVHEETGITLQADQLQEVGSGRWRTDRLGHNYVIFTAMITKQPVTVSRPYEIIAVKWVQADAFGSLVLAPEVCEVLRHIST